MTAFPNTKRSLKSDSSIQSRESSSAVTHLPLFFAVTEIVWGNYEKEKNLWEISIFLILLI